MKSSVAILVAVFAFASALAAPSEGAATTVALLRVPDGGVQPQVAVDRAGTIHLIYLTGAAEHSDIVYRKSTDDGVTFSKPIIVNSQPGSAIATGTVRGAHLAIGREERAHVAWMGSSTAQPKAIGGQSPMLYARLNADGDAFEPQRNLIQSKPGLDGGASIAAGTSGNVYVAWHAPTAKGAGEQSRRVWLVQSSDDGGTFSTERSISDGKTGACGCCGMRLFAGADGDVYGLYRTANETIRRDMTLIRFDPKTSQSRSQTVGMMDSGVCVMSTAAFGANADGPLAAWEINEQIFWAKIGADFSKTIDSRAVAGNAKDRKHPAIAANAAGQILVVWTEGTGWNRGGTIAWQMYDPSGKEAGSIGHAQRLPVWGAPAAFALPDGTFVILY